MFKDGDRVVFARIHSLFSCTESGTMWPMAIITRFPTISPPHLERIGMRKVEESWDEESEIICTDDIFRAGFISSTDDETHHPPPVTTRIQDNLVIQKHTYFVNDMIDNDLFLRLHVHPPRFVQ